MSIFPNLARLGAAALAATLLSPSAQAQGLPEGLSALLDAARTEGQVSIFVSTDARTAEDEAAIRQAILTETGVDLTVRLVSGAPDPVYFQQVIQELGAGVTPSVDLIVSVPSLLVGIRDAGGIASTDWLALGAPSEEVAAPVHGLFTAEFARPVIYNTTLLTEDEVPHSLEDLLTPEWAGRIVTASLPDVFSPWAIALGHDGVLEMVETLYTDLNVGIAPAPTAIRTLVESGQYPIGFGIRPSHAQLTSGSPVAYAPIKAPAVPRYAAIVSGTGHENAATVVAWVLSQTESGQTVAARVLDWPRRTVPGTDLYDFSQQVGGLYSASADWWLGDFFATNQAVAELLRDL
ncbi:ABC transporter substrate-binding protein [Pararhodobacter sp.]|uniref:ABC transporter substrate-binding protein n=1 Tax=Pararhodobacter sp. TaxID=2127056 RepID=UPI002AFFF336|nr:ABC transporter substrate-binding protein [Pararhodobacter sp.]